MQGPGQARMIGPYAEDAYLMAEATLNNLDQDRMIAHAFFVLVALLTRGRRKTLTEIEVDVRSLQACCRRNQG